MTMTLLPNNSGTFGDVRAMTPFPEWVRNLAFQLWAWSCSQNSAKVATLLNSGDYRDDGGFVPEDAMLQTVSDDGERIDHNPPLAISRQAINHWKARENWEDRRIAEIRELTPAVHTKVAGNLGIAALAAEEFIADILAGRIVAEDATGAKMIQVRFQAAQDVLSRAGHLPHTRPKDDTALPGPTADHRKAIAGKSREERERMAWGLSAGASGANPATVDAGSELVI